MDKDERKRLKKLGKRLVERESEALKEKLRESNPHEPGSDGWAKAYRESTLKEREIRKNPKNILRTAEIENDYIINIKQKTFSDGFPRVKGMYYQCLNCGCLLHSLCEVSLICDCGNFEIDLNNQQMNVGNLALICLVKLIGKA